MDDGAKNKERRKFLSKFMVVCLGVLCLGGWGMLYRRTRHVDEYLRTLEN